MAKKPNIGSPTPLKGGLGGKPKKRPAPPPTATEDAMRYGHDNGVKPGGKPMPRGPKG